MPTVQFICGDAEAMSIEVVSGTPLIDIVRALVRDGQLQMSWRCGQGTCGSCQCYIEHVHSRRWITISSKERNVLVRHAQMPINMTLDLFDSPQQVRLACYLIVENDLIVRTAAAATRSSTE